jgi:hypothetical protein
MNMRIELLALGFALLPAVAGADPANRFDGAWVTTVSCANAAGALGYSFEVPTKIKDSLLHGERMHAGEPGWMVLDGQIQPDGQARLTAKGLVGASAAAVGARPKGSDYGYHVDAKFEDARGTGVRIEGRHCDLSFVRQ